MNILEKHNDLFDAWMRSIKERIQQIQIKAALSVNKELIALYWDLGKQIAQKQEESEWGSGFFNRISRELKLEFPDLKGFSPDNLRYTKLFYLFYRELTISEQVVRELEDAPEVILEQLVPKNKESEIIDKLASIPWGHNIVILKKIKNQQEALFYVYETAQNNWSRSVLQLQIENNLFARQGKSVNNFSATLPKPQSDLANQILKDPYNFNFLTLERDVKELDVEKQLVKNISNFLLELGKGFAYMGRQFALNINDKEYRLDLLFYHVRLKCYVVIELKTVDLEPEYVGKLNFYLSAIDSLVKSPDDSPTIGMLLCKTKDNLEVEFSLRDVNKPIGVSEFSFTELPLQIQNAMPTIEELESELFKDI